MQEPDATFADPRQADLYDIFNNDRSDLEAYVTIANEVEAHRVVDVGCGTGSLAVRLAELGFLLPASTLLEALWTLPRRGDEPNLHDPQRVPRKVRSSTVAEIRAEVALPTRTSPNQTDDPHNSVSA